MKNKKLGIGIAVLTLVIITAGFTASSFAYQGDPNVPGPNHSPERHEAMVNAFETGDYSAWKDLMDGKGRITEVVNEDNFAKFAEAYELAKSGDMEKAREIRAELGLGQGGQNRGMRSGTGERGAGKRMNGSVTRGQNTGDNL